MNAIPVETFPAIFCLAISFMGSYYYSDCLGKSLEDWFTACFILIGVPRISSFCNIIHTPMETRDVNTRHVLHWAETLSFFFFLFWKAYGRTWQILLIPVIVIAFLREIFEFLSLLSRETPLGTVNPCGNLENKDRSIVSVSTLQELDFSLLITGCKVLTVERQRVFDFYVSPELTQRMNREYTVNLPLLFFMFS